MSLQSRFTRGSLSQSSSSLLQLERPSSVTTSSAAPSLQGSPLSTTDLRLSTSRSASPAADPFPVRHSTYYFQDDMAVFMVEDCLFRVHRFHLDRETQIFPKGSGQKDEPVELPGVTKTEFECLLDFFYGGMHNETTPSLLAWTSLLSISTHFDMYRVRDRAIMEIETFYPPIDSVDKVVLAVKHNVPEWLPPTYAALCQRADPIDIEEGRKLGLETTVLLAKARERVRNSPNLRPPHFKISSGSLARGPRPEPPRTPEPPITPQECYPARLDTPFTSSDRPPSWSEYYPMPEDRCYTPDQSSISRPTVHPKCSPFPSPGIAQPVPLPAIDVRFAVTDVSLVRRVVDETFWPASTPPGAPRAKEAKKGKKKVRR